MLLKIRHALLEINNPPNCKQSAIVINNEIIITSACLLHDYVRPTLPYDSDPENDNVCASTKIIRALQNGQLLNCQENNKTAEAEYLQSFSYQVTFDRRNKLPINARGTQQSSVSSRQPHILTRYAAHLLYLFNSVAVAKQLRRFMIAFNPPAADEPQYEVLLSSFMVLTMRPALSEQGSERFERFLQHIAHYLRHMSALRALDDVLAMCSPFGLENFYKTISIGKISNVMGKDGCLFVISNALPLGCEGSAVFNNKLRLIGIIISTAFQRQQENVNLTLAASFSHLLRDFMQQLGIPITVYNIPREPANFAWERTMVVIEAAGHQGTGTFIRVHNKKFILTCAHVVFELNSKATCRSADGEFESDIVWRNPQYNQAFDVALLTVPESIPNRYCVRLSANRPAPGQTVFNAGFPYFVNFQLKYDFNPSIFQGRIIKCVSGAIMSDGCVQAGQSGGPMFDESGCILGVCVSNVKVQNVVYPNINSAVPICEIRETLESFAKTNDVEILNNLVANREIQRVWSMEAPPVLSKL